MLCHDTAFTREVMAIHLLASYGKLHLLDYGTDRLLSICYSIALTSQIMN